MKDIYIDEVKLKNCRGHFEMEMDFPIDNFTVIQGKNGAGKSTIPKAISMCLFGDDGAPAGEKISITEMVNRKKGKDLEIKVYFREIDSDTHVTDEYRVELYYGHHKYQNQLFLFKNNVPISGKTKGDTYRQIEQILYPKEIYHNVINFSQQVKNFFTSLTNAQQKEIFDSILQTKIYNVYYANDLEAENTLKQVLQELEMTLGRLDHEISWRATDIEKFKKEKEDFEKKQNQTISDDKATKIRLENEIQLISDQIEDLAFSESEYESTKKQCTILEQKISQIEQRINEQIARAESEKVSEWKTFIIDVEKRQQSEKEKIRNLFEQEKTKYQTEKSKLYELISEISKRYDTSSIVKDRLDFEREKQKEIQQVSFMISQLDLEFFTSKLEVERDQRLEIIDRNIQELRDKASELKSKASIIKKNIEDKKLDLKKDEESISGDIPICTKCLRPFHDEKDIKVIQESISNVQLIIEDLENQLKLLEKEMVTLKTEFEECNRVKTKVKLDYDDRIKEIVVKKNQKSRELQNKQNLIQCEIDEYRKICDEKIKDLNSKIEKETQEHKLKQKEIDISLESLQQKTISELENITSVFAKETQNEQIEHNKKYVQIQLDLREKINKETQNLKSNLETCSLARKTYENIKASVDSLTTAKSSMTLELVFVNKNLQAIESEQFDETKIISAEEEKNEIEKKREFELEKKRCLDRELEILRFWKIGFSDSGIKSMLIDMAIPHMNEAVSAALEKIAPGVFTVSFDTLRETKSGDVRDKFTVNVLHNIKGTDSHKLLSGGEKRLVDLSCMEALRSLVERLYGKRIHNIFYDEVLDSLDEDNRQLFCQVLKMISKDKNVTLITHNTAEDMEPDRIFKF